MFEKAFVEVYEIVSRMQEDDIKKIDSKFLEFVKENRDLSFNFKYDDSKALIDQDLSDDAESILLYMYIKFFATSEEKKQIKKEVYEDYKLQKLKKGDNNK